MSTKPRLVHTFAAPFAAALLLVAVTPSASAIEEGRFAFKTTSDLYQICSVTASDPDETAAQTACTAFIAATVQYHDEVSDRKHLKRLICYPQGTTIADSRNAFLAWAGKNKANAKRMDEAPVVGLVRALATTYPCK